MTASPVTNVSAHTVGYIPDFDPANYTEQLSADNAKKLVESGIPLNFATEVIGIRTAAVVEDLPEDLSVYANATGTVFPLRCADGRVVHQLRKDNVPPPSPGKKSPKYLQAKGTGALITVHPNQEARVGNVSRVWIVEGTKQAVCAAFYAPEDVLVVGIQGCANWTSEGVGVPDLGQIVLDGAEVAILFDADRTSKRAVYDAGTNLATYLTSLGAASVSFAARAGVGTAGLDDVLGGLPFARRASFLANLVAIGNEKPGRRPAAPVKTKTKASMYCDMSTGTTRTVADDDEPSQVKLDAAARIAEVLNMADPDNPDKIIAPVLKLEVAMPSEEGTDVFQATITSEKLTDIGAWLDQHPSGTSVIINRPSDLKERNEIANAIRSCDNENLITVHAVPRTGWTPIDGEQRYLHQGGALGADGNLTTWRAHLPVRYRAIDFAKAAEKAMDPIELRAAVRSVIDAADLLIDQTPWWCGLGGIAIAQSGAVPNTAVGIVAEKSAGKTLCLTTLTSFLSPDFAYRRRIMAVADGTANAVDLAMNGLDNSFLLVDDWHPEIDVRERIRQAKSLDGILRRVHGAPSKARAMIDRQVDGVVLAPVNNSHPFLMLSMERLPARQDAESMLDRMLTISLTAAKTFRRGDAAKMEQLGQSGLPQIANVGLLMWIADLIREQDPEDPISAMQQWIASIDESRNRITSVMSDRSLTSSARGTQVAAAMMAGVELWLDFAEYVGAVTTQESNEIGDRVISTLLDACAAHTDLAMGGNTSESINLIRDLKAALTAGELTLDTPQGGQRRLGKITTVNGTKCIAILTNRTFAGIDAGMVEAALRPIVIQYKEKNRVRYTHQVLFPAFEADDDFGADTPANSGGHRIRCFCIALDVWDEA